MASPPKGLPSISANTSAPPASAVKVPVDVVDSSTFGRGGRWAASTGAARARTARWSGGQQAAGEGTTGHGGLLGRGTPGIVRTAPWKSRGTRRGWWSRRRTVRGVGSGVRRSYDVVAERYAATVDRELDHRPLERALFAALPELAGLDRAPGVVADLGAGPGHVARHLRDLGLPTMAVDVAPAMAAVARHRHGVPAAVGSLTALPLASSSVAAAVVLFAWIHLTDDELPSAAGELAGRAATGRGGGDLVPRRRRRRPPRPVARRGRRPRLPLPAAGRGHRSPRGRRPARGGLAGARRYPRREAPTRRCYLVARST